jgi:hypothetical protein
MSKLVYAEGLVEPGSCVVTTQNVDDDVGEGVAGVVAAIVDEPTGVYALLVVPEEGWVLWAPIAALSLDCEKAAGRDRVVRWATAGGLGDWSSLRDDAEALVAKIAVTLML